MPHMPKHIQLQMAEPGSLLFVKYFSAAIFEEILPDFSILEQVQFFYWSIGPVASIGQLEGEAPNHFPFYESTPHAAAPLFMSLDGVSSEFQVAATNMLLALIGEHISALMWRNRGCPERMAEPEFTGLLDNQQIPWRMMSNLSEKILKRFRIKTNPELSYISLPPTTLQQINWVPPSRSMSFAIEGLALPESTPSQPLFSKMPKDIMDMILARVRPALQFSGVTFRVCPSWAPWLEYLEKPRMSYVKSEGNVNVDMHLPPIEVLFAQDTVPHKAAGGSAAKFFASNTFNLTNGLALLRHLPVNYSVIQRRVELNIYLNRDFYASFHDQDLIGLVGRIASCAGLEELRLNLYLYHMTKKHRSDLPRLFDKLAVFRHLSKIRGVRLLGTFDAALLEQQNWLRTCMAQPKEDGSMTSYEGMTSVEELQVHIEQEVELYAPRKLRPERRKLSVFEQEDDEFEEGHK